MFTREAKMDITTNALGAGNSCSTYVNGLLSSVRVFLDWNPAIAHSVKIFRSLSSGSTTQTLFAVTGTTVGSSETWYEFFPRGSRQASTVGSSQVSEMFPVEGHLHARVASSSGFSSKVATVIVSVI